MDEACLVLQNLFACSERALVFNDILGVLLIFNEVLNLIGRLFDLVKFVDRHLLLLIFMMSILLLHILSLEKFINYLRTSLLLLHKVKVLNKLNLF